MNEIIKSIICLWFLSAVPALAAVTIDQTSSTAAATDQTSPWTGLSFTCTTGHPYAVRIQADAAAVIDSGAGVGATYNGHTLTSAGTASGTGGSDSARFFISDATGTGCDGASHVVSITLGDTADHISALAQSYTGADTTTPFDTTATTGYNTNSGGVSPITCSVTLSSGDLMIGLAAVNSDPTPDAGQTDEGEAGNVFGHGATYGRKTGTGVTTLSWTEESPESWVSACLRVVAAGGGGGVTPTRSIRLFEGFRINLVSGTLLLHQQ